MKNFNAKIALFFILAAVSLSCTVFLNTQHLDVKDNELTLEDSELLESSDLKELDEKTTPLMDVRLIQMVLETGKKFVPGNH